MIREILYSFNIKNVTIIIEKILFMQIILDDPN